MREQNKQIKPKVYKATMLKNSNKKEEKMSGNKQMSTDNRIVYIYTISVVIKN